MATAAAENKTGEGGGAAAEARGGALSAFPARTPSLTERLGLRKRCDGQGGGHGEGEGGAGEAPLPHPADTPTLFSSTSSSKMLNVDILAQELEREDEESTVPVIVQLIVSSPETMYTLFLCLIFLAIPVTVALFAAGAEPINFDRISDVGLFDATDEFIMRWQAYNLAIKEANFTLEVAQCPREGVAYKVDMILEDKSGGNVLTQAGLRQLEERERKFTQDERYSDYCFLYYGTSFSPQKHLEYDTDLERLGCTVRPQIDVPTSGGTNSQFNYTNTLGCVVPYSPTYWFAKYGDPDYEDVEGTVDLIRTTSSADFTQLSNMLSKSQFDPDKGKYKSNVMRTTLFYGSPLGNITTRVFYEQESDEDDLYSNEEQEVIDYLDQFESYLDDGFSDSPVRTLFTYFGYEPIQEQVLNDMTLLLLSFCLIFLYMWFSTGSLWLTLNGIGQTICAFFAGMLIYRYLWPSPSGIGYNYFHLFCALSVFIILGISADDVFVYVAHWQESEHAGFDKIVDRKAHVYRHASKAMLVTSLTTAISFFSNNGSPFIGIVAFGTFAGLLVIVNYIMVITFFPSAVYMYHKYFQECPFGFGLGGWCIRKWHSLRKLLGCPVPVGVTVDTSSGEEEGGEQDQRRQSSKASDDSKRDTGEQKHHEDDHATRATPDATSDANAAADRDAESRSSRSSRSSSTRARGQLSEEEETITCRLKRAWRRLKRFDLSFWFRTVYADAIEQYKYVVLTAFAGLVITFLVFATMVKPVPFVQYELMSSGTNFREYFEALFNTLPANANPLVATVVWGIDTDEYVNYGADFKPYDFVFAETGDVVYDRSFSMEQAQYQMQYEEACHRVVDSVSDEYKYTAIDDTYGINPQIYDPDSIVSIPGSTFDMYGTQCVMDAVRFWEQNGTSRWEGPPTNRWVADIVPGNRWNASTDVRCRYCFNNFTTSPHPNSTTGVYTLADPPEFLLNATNVLDNCNCMGLFPIPHAVCFNELGSLDTTSRFRCIVGNFLIGELEQWLLTPTLDGTAKEFQHWEPYMYATSKNGNEFDRFALITMTVQTTRDISFNDYKEGMRMVRDWDDWIEDFNKEFNENNMNGFIYFDSMINWRTVEQLGPAAVRSVFVGLFLAFIVLVFATRNWIIAAMAISNIGFIVICVFGYMKISGWNLGPLESICSVLVVGFSVDFTVHLAEVFTRHEADTRLEKVREALGLTGSSIVSGGFSTMLASAPMLFAVITFFQKFGTFLFLTVALSLTFSLGCFVAMLLVIGPLGNSGKIINIYGPYLERAFVRSLKELGARVDLDMFADATTATASPKGQENDPDSDQGSAPGKNTSGRAISTNSAGDPEQERLAGGSARSDEVLAGNVPTTENEVEMMARPSGQVAQL